MSDRQGVINKMVDTVFVKEPAQIHAQKLKIEQQQARIAELEGELEIRKSHIQFWSYCTWQGMLATCLEKEEVLRDFFKSMSVEPWTFCETGAPAQEADDEN